jgi:hypothetical protein
MLVLIYKTQAMAAVDANVYYRANEFMFKVGVVLQPAN